MKSTQHESTALKISAGANLSFGLLGIGFALVTQSGAILLDGIFSFAGFALALLTLKVSDLVERPDDEWFHFGYAYFEPVLNSVRGLILIAVTGYALFSAITALLHGGRHIVPEWALVYAVIALAGCLLLAWIQGRAARAAATPLLDVDAKAWLMDGFLSLVVAATFLGALLVQGTRWEPWASYVDPALVVLLVLLVLPVPLKIIRENMGELLRVAPGPDVQAEVRSRFLRSVEGRGFRDTRLRMIAAGRYFYLLNHIRVDRDFRIRRVAELDAIRADIHAALEDLHPRLVIDTVFTEDERWMG
jgi:cation diffusion facilitator family transporter